MALDVAKLARSPQAFRDALVIDTARGPVRLAEAITANDWQREDFEALDPGWMLAAGLEPPAGRQLFQRAWLERPRGHSKTSDTAVSVAWCLFAAPRRRTGVLAAASKDQAGLLRDAVEQLVRVNPWLKSYLEVQANVVINKHTGSRCEVLSSEAHTSWGLLVDFIAIDEITHWPTLELWFSLLSAIAKKEHGFLQVISNAGFAASPQEELYHQVQATDSGWWFHSLDGPLASWVSPANLEEQRRMLPAVVYDRVWLNQWTSGEDSAISDSDLKAANVLPGPVKPNELWRRENWAVGGLDIGVKKDRSGFVVLGVPNGEQLIRLAHAQSWKPPRGGEVNLSEVERAVLKAKHDYGLRTVAFDPAQALHVAQRLRRQGVNMVEMPFVPKNLDVMARSLMMTFREGQIQIYDHRELIRDLRQLKIQERMAGLRLTAVSGSDGHCDLGIAFSIALPAAETVAQNRFRNAGKDTLRPKPMQVAPDHGRLGVLLKKPDPRRAGWQKMFE